MTRKSETEIQFQEGLQKIYDLVLDVAKQEGIKLKSIKLDDGRTLECLDYHVLDIAAGEHSVSTKLNHEEIEDYPGHAGIDITEMKIRTAIDRLRLMMEA